ncbi:MAG: hypothetical protein ACI9JM_003345 [Halioglobus sp.]|jgi:hypothetical protein
MPLKKQLLNTSLLVLALFVLGGCVQTKTAPGYARAGDYIVLGLGGVQRNANGEASLKSSDLTITLTDANNVDHTLAARYVFRSYLDYNSWMNDVTLGGTATILGLTDMVPFDGGWFAVTPLTFPGMYSSPLPLAVGAATVSVTSPKLTNINNSVEGDQAAIPIEIIAGTSPDDNNYQRQFLGYSDSRRNFLIEPDDLTGITEVGGAFLVITYNDDSFLKTGVDPMVVPADHNPFVQLSYNHVPNGDGTGTIYVTLMNPSGFKTVATATQNSSLLANLAVRMMYFPSANAVEDVLAKASFSVDTVNSYYIDLSGAVLSGVSPVMTHAVDL